MKTSHNDPRTRQFIANVGLITSKGSFGNNIMAAEWTHQISREPAIFSVAIGNSCDTKSIIKETKEFGINLASVDQNIIASIAGGSNGSQVDKIELLKEFGVKFKQAKDIDVLMLTESAVQIECKVTEIIDVGTYVLFIAEAVNMTHTDNQPLAYHQGKYWKMTEQISKPSQEEIDKVIDLTEKYSR